MPRSGLPFGRCPRLWTLCILSALFSGAPPLRAEPSIPAPLERADAAFAAEQWDEAAAAYREVVAADPSDGRAWTRLGRAHEQRARDAEAIEAWLEAERLGFAPGFVRYSIATAEARRSNADAALDWLARAVEVGFSDEKRLARAAEWNPLRERERFAELARAVRRNARPCEFDQARRQFDFWLGEWDVANRSGRPVGRNTIRAEVRGCTLTEEWHSANGGAGRSINYYDAHAGLWRQIWVDGRGGSIVLAGGWKDGSMRLEGKHFQADGTVELSRGTWTPLADGRVRQFFEQSRDEGANWYPWFEGFYSRRIDAAEPTDCPPSAQSPDRD